MKAVVNDLLHLRLISILAIQQGEGGKERHLRLLRQRKPGGMVQGDLTAVGNHTVDETDFLWMERNTAIAFVQLLFPLCRQFLQHPVVYILFVQRDNGQAPACRSEIFGEGIDAEGVLRQFRHDRTEMGNVGRIDIIGNDHQVRIVITYDIYNTFHQTICQTVRRRIARIDDKGGLDRRVFQNVQVFFLVLPGMIAVFCHFTSVDFGYIEQVAGLFRYLYIRSEYRGEQDDLVTFTKKEILLQRIEYIAHRGGSPFGSKEIELPFGRAVVAQFLLQVVFDQYFRIFQDAVGNGILVPDDAFRPFVYEVVLIDSFLIHKIIVGVFQQCHTGRAGVLHQELRETGGDTFLFGDTGQSDHFLAIFGGTGAFFQSELAEQEKGFAGYSTDPVRIATPCVQHDMRTLTGTFVRKVYQDIFQFERTDF